MSVGKSPTQYLGVLAQNPPDVIKAERAPTSNDRAYNVGDIWVDTTNGAAYINYGGGSWVTAGTTAAAPGNFTTVTADQLQINGGAATDFIGTATLVSGTVTVANTNIAATDRIFIQRTAANASTTLGELSYTISAGASFTITSLILGTPASPQTADVSTVTYLIVRQV